MLKKVLKFIGIGIGAILILALGLFLYASSQFSSRKEKIYAVQIQDLEIPSDSAAIARGKHIAIIKGCNDCHGEDYAGKVMMEDNAVGRLVAANITGAKGSATEGFLDKDWVRALKHGIRKNGESLFLMPSYEYAQLSKEDLADLIAYLKTLKAVEKDLPLTEIGPLSKILTHLDKMPLFPAEKIDHSAKYPTKPGAEDQLALGKYLTASCVGCHGLQLKGAPAPAPGMMEGPDITASGRVKRLDENAFRTVLKTGKTPEGRQIENKNMPWKMTAEFTEDELLAIFKYLKSI